ncbi:MAG: TonB family protein [Phreatobacter sp.]|uniref:energy transducer TonB n=1 Tax=Phreatobacter sp. TaxID=1966341 RepID=UPI001A36E426|nr:TonB family protein [Phreatobacter sp.]MBL8568381.1 TonB family protein [Phreatobacter sp.]
MPVRARVRLPDRLEPILFTADGAPASGTTKTEAAIIAMAVKAVRQEAGETAAPPVVAIASPSPAATAPEVLVSSAGATAAVAPDIALAERDAALPVDRPAKRVTASVVASVLLHVGAVVLFAWASLNAPVLPADGEDGIPVELVAAADQAAASQQEIASGKEDGQAPATTTEARQAVEAPPAETPPERPATEPTDATAEQPPVAQPDPVTTAERIIDQLPTPPMPDTLPIMDRAPPPPPVETQPVTEPVQETPPPPNPQVQPQPVQETPPQPVEDPTQRVETPQPSEVQAMVSPPAVEPPPAPPQLAATPSRPVTPPVVQREQRREPAMRRQATRPPPTRREAPTDASRTRPTRQTAATPSPEREARAARQAESRAASAPRGEGVGRQNRQAAAGNAASGGANAAAVASYRQRAIAHVARFKIFPQAAQDRGQRGSVGFTFTVTRGGQVTSVAVTASSGVPMLDQATLSMVRRAVPFPPIPEGGPASMTISTRIGYTLH